MLPGATVRPATCEVELGDRVERLEPRVMQVLVALVTAQGRVVSRDTLVEQCWDGLTVGDDAINRVTARLRRLGLDSGAFALETVRKVGYRLAVTGEDSPATPSQQTAHQRQISPRRRSARVSAILNVTLLAITAAAMFHLGHRQEAVRAAGQTGPVSAVALSRLPGRWGPAGCVPTYDLVVRSGRVVMTAPGYRSERRILSGGAASVLTEGVLPLDERGRLIEFRVDGEQLTVQNRSTDTVQPFSICPLTKR